MLHIPCLEALHFANLTARPQKSWVLLSLVPARGPAPPTPSRRESERSELAAYLLCMDANGSCLQCISIGALQTAGRPTLPPPGAKGLPSEATEPRCQAGNCASWAQKALLELLFLSQSRSAGDRSGLSVSLFHCSPPRGSGPRPAPLPPESPKAGLVPGVCAAFASPDTLARCPWGQDASAWSRTHDAAVWREPMLICPFLNTRKLRPYSSLVCNWV